MLASVTDIPKNLANRKHGNPSFVVKILRILENEHNLELSLIGQKPPLDSKPVNPFKQLDQHFQPVCEGLPSLKLKCMSHFMCTIAKDLDRDLRDMQKRDASVFRRSLEYSHDKLIFL